MQNLSPAPTQSETRQKNRDAARTASLSVVIPVHNEARNIFPLVEEIHAALDQLLTYEIVYVDDSSSDDTMGKLREAESKWQNIRIVSHRNNCGQSTALCTGVRAAHSDWVVTLDGDGQNDPADIPKLWDKCTSSGRNEKLIICGYRRQRRDTWLKRISSRIANRFRQFILKDATPDTGCGIKLFSRAAFLKLPYFDHMHRFLPALFLRQGGAAVSVEVNHRPRTRGQSHYGMANRLWIGLVDTFGVAWLQRRMKLPIITEEKNNEA
jgi:dolichol-phosphate mannosyltransferase